MLFKLLKTNQTSVYATINQPKSDNARKTDFEILNVKENYTLIPDDFPNDVIVTQGSPSDFEDYTISDADKKRRKRNNNLI